MVGDGGMRTLIETRLLAGAALSPDRRTAVYAAPTADRTELVARSVADGVITAQVGLPGNWRIAGWSARGVVLAAGATVSLDTGSGRTGATHVPVAYLWTPGSPPHPVQVDGVPAAAVPTSDYVGVYLPGGDPSCVGVARLGG